MTRGSRAAARDAAAGVAAGRAAIAGDFELTPEVEAALDALARAARDDPGARNDLYAALEVKIARFLAAYRRRHAAVGEFADLEQEAFLVFARLVADWGGAGGFGRYFLSFFPWRLRHRVEAYERRWPPRRLVFLPLDLLEELRADGAPEVEPATWLEPLGADERRLLRLRLGEARPLDEVAPLFGWSRRTAFRRWRALLDRLERRETA